jgi:hemerythrin-like domain-containing protein
MNPTQILVDEHSVILRVLSALEKMAQQTEQVGLVDPETGGQFVDFIATFADRCHHGKEEDQLFPALFAKGMPKEAGPIAVMLGEHDEGRVLVRRMRAAVGGEGDPAADYAAAARSFVGLLRDHIAKENEVLFPMAEAMLTPDEKRDVLAAFERVEHDEMGPETHGNYLALARQLCDRFGVDWQAEPAMSAAGGCCGHHGGCH